jgi:hypothetical protein
MKTSKPKVIKEYDKLSEELQERLREVYPDGFSEHFIRFTDKDGKYIVALPLETEDRYYMVNVTGTSVAKLPKPPKDEDEGPKDEESEAGEDRYTDLDSMRVGGGKKSDEDEEYD